MNRNNCIFILIFLLILAFCLTSCSKYLDSDNDYYGGELIDKDKLSSIADSVFNEESTDKDLEDGDKTEHNGVYYWSAKGNKYHKWSDCEQLKGIAEVFEGNITEAFLAGKSNLCSECAKK